MRRLIPPLVGALASLVAFAPSVHAAGFGTPVIDGVVDAAIYGAAEAVDPVDPPQGNAPMDLGSLYVANDANFWYFLFTVNTDIVATNWGKYLIFIDTTNDVNGATTDAWGRAITVSDPHKAEYSLRGWFDGGGAYGVSKTQFWQWSAGAWSQNGTADAAAVSAGAVSGVEWKIARSKLGDPSQIWVEVVSTGGSPSDNAQDTCNDPADDWNATDWSTPAVIANSTLVPRSSGSDTTPPTVVGAEVLDPASGFSDTVRLTFSEPLDPASATNAANYAAPGRSVFTPSQPAPDQVDLVISPVYSFGACNQITVTNVKDVALNTIVNNGDTNVGRFFAFRIHMRGHMSIHMRNHDVPPHTFAIEGSTAPLTWDPLCDDLLTDADDDSVWTANLDFSLPCTAGGPVVTNLEYKFTHQCTEYESISNHFYAIDPVTLGAGVDTLDIWWNDEAPSNFTAQAVDVVFTIRSFASNPPFGAGDSLGIGGSALPLDWQNPPVNLLADNGVLPDVTAGDGVYSKRITFPAGTLKSVDYKYLLKPDGGGAFDFECSGGSNRNVFLDDTIFSTTNPIVLALAHYDDCAFATDAPAIAAAGGFALDPSRPNPMRGAASISYSLPKPGHVALDVYDVSGRHVRSLLDETRPAGAGTVVWDGRNVDGSLLPGGVYFLRLTAGDLSQTRKVVLAR